MAREEQVADWWLKLWGQTEVHPGVGGLTCVPKLGALSNELRI